MSSIAQIARAEDRRAQQRMWRRFGRVHRWLVIISTGLILVAFSAIATAIMIWLAAEPGMM